VRALAAVREQGVDARLRIVGPSTNESELRHREQLQQLVCTLGLQKHVSLEDGVPQTEVVDLMGQVDLLINTTVAGSGDKTVFEAMARGCPVLASNPSFRDLLSGHPVELSFAEADHRELAARIVAYVKVLGETQLAVATELRRRIEKSHSLDGWADAVVSGLTE
jgi:glycosyltransferase involved in cell wall biosynthesis